MRTDGRGLDRFRKISVRILDLGQVEVNLGKTKVFCSVSGEIVKPKAGEEGGIFADFFFVGNKSIFFSDIFFWS